MDEDKESLSQGQCTKFSLQHVPWAVAEGGKSGLETPEESLGLVALERELKGQPPGSLL